MLVQQLMRIWPITRCRSQKAARLALGWVVLLLPSHTVFSQDLDPWTVTHFGQAVQAQHDGNLQLAESEYKLVISRNPRLAAAYLNLGIVYHQAKKYSDAVTVLRTAVQLDPHSLGAQLFLGIDEYLTAEFKDAKEHLKRALSVSPQDRQAGLYLGLDDLVLAQPFQAITVLRQTAKDHPGDTEVLYHLGEAHLQAAQLGAVRLNQLGDQSALAFWSLAITAKQRKDFVGALEDSMKALALDPYIAELYWEIAATLREKMPEIADDALARYQKLDPEHGPIPENTDGADMELDQASRSALDHYWRRVPPIHDGAGAPAVADSPLNQLLEKPRRSGGSARLNKALDLYAKGRYRDAANELDGTDFKDTDWSPVYLQALSYERAGDHEKAEEVFAGHLLPYMAVPSVAFLAVRIETQIASESLEEVVTAQPDSYMAKLLLGKYYASAKQEDAALAQYQEALKLAPNQPGIHLAIAEVYASKRLWAQAIQEYRSELALAPTNNIALADLGHALTESRDAADAAPVLQEALRADPSNSAAYTDLGEVWEVLGEQGKAIEAYQNALRFDPSLLNLHYKLSRLYQKQGQHDRAEKELAAFQAGEAQQRANDRKVMEVLQSP
jgi:tetratricopeptide (TPR) repeat protein